MSRRRSVGWHAPDGQRYVRINGAARVPIPASVTDSEARAALTLAREVKP